jgi:hypothetical protein
MKICIIAVLSLVLLACARPQGPPGGQDPGTPVSWTEAFNPGTELYNLVDSLPKGSTVLLSFDYDSSTEAELQPMAVALLRHLFSRRIFVIGTALWLHGAGLGQQALTQAGDNFGIQEYEDWVNLGYLAEEGLTIQRTGSPIRKIYVPGSILIQRMGSSIRKICPQDHAGVPYDSIPMLRDIRGLRDIDMVISLSAGDPGIHAWAMIAGDTYGVPVGGGCTTAGAPEFYAYLGTGRLAGLLGGLRGTADYEVLLRGRIPKIPYVIPVVEFEVVDMANDGGGSLELSWNLGRGAAVPESLQIIRASADSMGNPAFVSVAFVPAELGSFVDENLSDGVVYTYELGSWFCGRIVGRTPEVSSASSAQWFSTGRTGMLVILALLTAVILIYIERAKRGHKLYVREIGGLSAVDDAVGRATEMGRPVLYIPGIMDMDDIQTIASMVILGRVASKVAEYGANLLVPNTRSVVMSVAQEVVKEAYLSAGRPDAYRRENINYLTDDQFGYAAGVDGIMLRQRPAAIFLLGTFYAESLILAETGKSVGAIQIAGTAMVSQLPFFIAACDYTLIGEELFAASAYLSREPKLLGSLKGQDAAKLVIMILIATGVLASTLGGLWHPASVFADFLRFLTHVD